MTEQPDPTVPPAAPAAAPTAAPEAPVPAAAEAPAEAEDTQAEDTEAGAEDADAEAEDAEDAADPNPAATLLAEAQAQAAENDLAGAAETLEAALALLGTEGEDGLLRVILHKERAQMLAWLEEPEGALAAIAAAEAEAAALGLPEDDAAALGAQLDLSRAWLEAAAGEPEAGLSRASAAAATLWQLGDPSVVDGALVRGLIGKLARGGDVATLEGLEGLSPELLELLVDHLGHHLEHVTPGLGLSLCVELHARLMALELPDGPLAPPRPRALAEEVAAHMHSLAPLAEAPELAVEAAAWVHRQRHGAGDAAGAILALHRWGEALIRAGRGDDGLERLRRALTEAEEARELEPHEAQGLRLLGLWALADGLLLLGRREGAGLAFLTAEAATAAPQTEDEQAGAVLLEACLFQIGAGQAEAALSLAAAAQARLDPEGAAHAIAGQIIDQDAFFDPLSGELDRLALLRARLALRLPPGLVEGLSLDDEGAVQLHFHRSPTQGEAGRLRLIVEAALRAVAA